VLADGPASQPSNPSKSELRKIWAQVEQAIDAYSSGAGSIAKQTLAQLNSDLAHAADVTAWVFADSTVSNNGIYRKTGASGVGSWTRILDLPFSFIIANDLGVGTPNAIQATTAIPVSASALVWLEIAQTNTGTPVTISFNGTTAKTIKTNSGSNVTAGGLVAGTVVMGIATGSTFRLLSDQASAAILAAAEAAQAAAELSAAQAAASAASVVDELDMSSYGGSDNGVVDNTASMNAYIAAAPNGGRLRFKRLSDTGLYLFTGGIPPVDGLYLDVDPGVTLKGVFSRPYSPGEVPVGVNHPKVVRRTRIIDTSTGTDVEMWLNPEYIQPLGQKEFFLGEGHLSRPRTEMLTPSAGKLVHQYVDWPAGDEWKATAPTALAGSVVWPAEALNRFRISFRETKWAEQINVAYNGDADAFFRAAAVRMASGYYVFWADRETSAINMGYKPAGGVAVISAFTIPGAATHDSQKPQWDEWGVQVINPFAFAILINGVRVKTVKTTSPITHMGLGVYNTTTTPTVLGWRLLKSKQFFGAGNTRILTLGDSTVGDIYGGFPFMMRQMLEGSLGVRVEDLINRGVGGWSSADVLADLTANGIEDGSGNLPTVGVLRVGANDIQAAISRTTFIANMEAIMNIFIAASVPLIVSVPLMFYSQALGGGTGQNTSNYYFGALYRAALEQSIANKYATSGLIYEADPISSMGHILGNYKGSDPLTYDAILRDNIHQTDGGYRLDAFAAARAVLDVISPETTKRSLSTALPTDALTVNGSCGYSNSWTAGTRSPEFSTDRDGQVVLNGFMSHASYTPADGEVIYTLPASLRPKTEFTRIVDRGSATLFVRLNLHPDGRLRIYGSLTNITQVDLGGISFARE
jgi:hypothetical protein